MCRNRLRLEKAEQERDEALKTVATLVSEKEGQLDSHRRLLKGAQDRELALVEKLKLAEVFMYFLDFAMPEIYRYTRTEVRCHCAQYLR